MLLHANYVMVKQISMTETRRLENVVIFIQTITELFCS